MNDDACPTFSEGSYVITFPLGWRGGCLEANTDQLLALQRSDSVCARKYSLSADRITANI